MPLPAATKKNDEEIYSFTGTEIAIRDVTTTKQVWYPTGYDNCCLYDINNRLHNTGKYVLSLSHYQACYIVEYGSVFIGKFYQKSAKICASIFSVYLKTGAVILRRVEKFYQAM